MELKQEIGFERAKDFLKQAGELAATRLELGSAEQGRATIIGIVEGAINRLSAKAEEHRRRGRSIEAKEAARREFDSSPQGAELKRQEEFWIRLARRSVKLLREVRRDFGPEASESGGGARKTGQRAEAIVREKTKREQRHVG